MTGEFTAADKAALEAVVAKERADRKTHEKAARDALAKLKKLEDADATELEKATKRADEAEAKITAATEKVRRANLLAALSDAGVTKAKAAARLLDGVEYDDDTDEPTNLDTAITAAQAAFGDEMFKGAAPPPPGDLNGGDGNNAGGNAPPLNADELRAAKASNMSPEEFRHYQDPHAGPYKPAGTT